MRGDGFLYNHVVTDRTAEHARQVEKKKLELEKALKQARLHKFSSQAARAEEARQRRLRDV